MRLTDRPLIAISVRQPWAWALLYAGKDIENRTQAGVFRSHSGPLAIHAALGMTAAEYRAAAQFIFERAGVWPPPREALTFGAIVGLMNKRAGVLTASPSRWFQGPYGLALAEPRPLAEPVPCKGQLGLWPVPLSIRQQIAAQGVEW